MGARWRLAQVMRDWAEVYLGRAEEGDGARARERLERAIDLYEEMELPFYFARVSEHLASLPQD